MWLVLGNDPLDVLVGYFYRLKDLVIRLILYPCWIHEVLGFQNDANNQV